LAGDVEFQTLRDEPLPLTPDSGRERSLHVLIVSQTRGSRYACRNSVGVISRATPRRSPKTRLGGRVGQIRALYE
jgi:hypothetical protein